MLHPLLPLLSQEKWRRRQVLAGLGATAAASLAGPALSAPAERPFRIDVHNHIVPPAFVQLLKDGGMWTPDVSNWSPAKAIEDLDRMGTQVALTSLPNPHDYPVGEAHRKLARDINEYAAKLAADHPGRFGNFASLPLPDIDGSLKEIAYAMDVLKADGFFVWTSYGDVWIGDESWKPLYEEWNRRNAIVYTHPRSAGCCGKLNIAVGEGAIEWQTDTTRALANVVFSGTAAKYPDITFIWSHGGGTMPFLVRRFITLGDAPANKEKVPGGFLAQARRMYYDTAQQQLPPQQWPLKWVATVPQIVYGTDYPFGQASATPAALRDSGVFTTEEIRAIERDNPLKLLPRFA